MAQSTPKGFFWRSWGWSWSSGGCPAVVCSCSLGTPKELPGSPQEGPRDPKRLPGRPKGSPTSPQAALKSPEKAPTSSYYVPLTSYDYLPRTNEWLQEHCPVITCYFQIALCCLLLAAYDRQHTNSYLLNAAFNSQLPRCCSFLATYGLQAALHYLILDAGPSLLTICR